MFWWRLLIYTHLLLEYGYSSRFLEFQNRDDFVQFLTANNPIRSLPSNEDDRPTVVTSELIIESFDSINENDMDISLTFLLKFSYYNEDLKWYSLKDVDIVVLDSELAEHFWTPELYVHNEKRVYVHQTFLPNKKYIFYDGGNVTFSTRDDFVQFLTANNPIRSLPSNEDDRPTVVTSELIIESFDSINENDMDISLTFLLKFSYYNEDLKWYSVKDVDIVVLDSELAEHFWTPELYVHNEKRVYVHQTFLPNKKYIFYDGGNVTFSTRLSMTIGCPMDFQTYPFDKQICKVGMESFLHDEKTIVLEWKVDKPVVLKGDSVGALPTFDLVKIDTKKVSLQNEEGNFSLLSLELTFVRNMGYYLMQMYIPCIISVIISWISFWIDVNAASERLGLGIVTVLTLVTHNADVNSQLPKVSYTKAIDVYTCTCLILVFLALLQYLLVYFFARMGKADGNGVDIQTNRHHSVALKMDIVSRIVFPFGFLVFNVVYWGFFLDTLYST